MNQRLKRIGDQIQREMVDLIRSGVKDPRLNRFITISDVKVSADLGYADIYVTFLESALTDEQNKDYHSESLEILNGAAGYLRGELGRRMKTRTTPRLRFHYDEVTAHGNHMLDLISQAMRETKAHEDERADSGANESESND